MGLILFVFFVFSVVQYLPGRDLGLTESSA
jgi:hypothetical protein